MWNRCHQVSRAYIQHNTHGEKYKNYKYIRDSLHEFLVRYTCILHTNTPPVIEEAFIKKKFNLIY